MATKRHFAVSFFAVWLSLDLAAEIARMIACQANPSAELLTMCQQPIGPAGTVLDKARRLGEAMNPPPPPGPPPGPEVIPRGGSQMERLRQQPGL